MKLYADTEQDTMLDFITKDPIFQYDEYSIIPEEWNKQRREVLRVCLNDLLLPIFVREAHERLLEEARDCVLKVIGFFK